MKAYYTALVRSGSSVAPGTLTRDDLSERGAEAKPLGDTYDALDPDFTLAATYRNPGQFLTLNCLPTPG